MPDPTQFEALNEQLNAIDLSLNQIQLDPNNPRFVGPDWSYVSTDRVANPGVQDATQGHLVTRFGIDKLSANMRVNGYLPIDLIVVQALSEPEGKYVVLEGNRRVCAAKLLAELIAIDTNAVSASVAESISSIPCLEYLGEEEDAAWIFQGLRHITGISEWPAFNKAKLLVEQMDDGGLSLTEVGQRFGLTPHGAGQWIRGYRAFKQAEEQSDFIHELDVQAYPYFQELFSRSSGAVREWMEWNDESTAFQNELNFNEFISWLYPREDEEDQPDAFGSFENRVLRRRDDIRQVAYLIRHDREIFERFRRELDVERAYSEATTRKFERESRDAERTLFEVLDECKNTLTSVPYRIMRDETSRTRLRNVLQEIQVLMEPLLNEDED